MKRQQLSGHILLLLFGCRSNYYAFAATTIPSPGGISSNAIKNKVYSGNEIVSIPLIPHHEYRRRILAEGGSLELEETAEFDRSHYRRRSLEMNTKPDQVAGLFQGYGTHYADLWCGTPPQRQTVIVDTGSAVTAFPCSDCKDCGPLEYHIDQLFIEENSSSFSKLNCKQCKKGTCASRFGKEYCKMSMSYQEGSSWSAYEAQDSCYVGGLHTAALLKDDKGSDDLDPYHAPKFAFPMKFGCQTGLTGLFKTQLADGIMGMDNAPAAFWQQMYDSGTIAKKMFSLCFSRSDTAAREGTTAGAMTMGGLDPRLHHDDMVFTSVQHSTGFYGVHIRKVYLRPSDSAKATQLDISEQDLNRGKTIVDSGTTDTYFTRRAAAQFKTIWKQIMGKEYSQTPLSITAEQVNEFPTILLQIKGDETLNQEIIDSAGGRKITGLASDVDQENPLDVIVAVPPSHYFEYDKDKKVYVARFYLDEGSGSVLGANTMMGHDVFFDVENYRIGWAESTCDYEALVEPFLAGHEDDKNVAPDVPDPAKSPEKKPDKPTPIITPDVDIPDKPSEPSHTGGTSIQDVIQKEENKEHGVAVKGESGVCSSSRCQAGVMSIILALVIIAAFRMFASKSSRPAYEMQTGEMELQTTVSAADGYRDGPGYKDGDVRRYCDATEGEMA